MNGYFHLYVGIVWDTASTLVCKIIHVGRVLAGIPAGIVELVLREHHQVTMKLATEGDVDVSGLIYVGNGARVVGKPADDFGLAIAESVVCFARGWYCLETWVGNSRASWIWGTVLTRDNDAYDRRGSVR